MIRWSVIRLIGCYSLQQSTALCSVIKWSTFKMLSMQKLPPWVAYETIQHRTSWAGPLTDWLVVTMEGSALGNTHNLYTSLIVNFKYWNSDFLQESCIPRIANRQNVSERSAVLWYMQLNDRITKQMNYYKTLHHIFNDWSTKLRV